jgi:hypothetical protein
MQYRQPILSLRGRKDGTAVFMDASDCGASSSNEVEDEEDHEQDEQNVDEKHSDVEGKKPQEPSE